MKILDRFKTSSKWQAGLGAMVWLSFRPKLIELGITEEQFNGLLYTVLALIGAQAATDFGKEKA